MKSSVRGQCGSGLLIEVLLKAGEDLPDFFGAAQVGNRVGDGVVVFELQ